MPIAEVNPEARTRVAILKRIFENFCRDKETREVGTNDIYWVIKGRGYAVGLDSCLLYTPKS